MIRSLWLPVCACLLASVAPSAPAAAQSTPTQSTPTQSTPTQSTPAQTATPPAATPPATTPPAAAPGTTITSAIPVPPNTDPAAADAAAQVVGLFMQSCVRFAGDPDGLRAWAPKAGMQPLPAQGQQAFLYGLPGVVFDASTKTDKLVVISENEGACSAMTEAASGPLVVKTLEQVMQQAHIDYTMTHEDDDQQEKTLHHREYTASQGNRHWDMLISVVKGAAPGEVMLTTNR
jgi:glucose/arabinose dehydrogenase